MIHTPVHLFLSFFMEPPIGKNPYADYVVPPIEHCSRFLINGKIRLFPAIAAILSFFAFGLLFLLDNPLFCTEVPKN